MWHCVCDECGIVCNGAAALGKAFLSAAVYLRVDLNAAAAGSDFHNLPLPVLLLPLLSVLLLQSFPCSALPQPLGGQGDVP